MDRRGFFRVLSAMAAIPFLANSSSAKSSERDYVEPFEGYNDYIKKLTGHLEEDVCVQERFILLSGRKEKITEIKRTSSKNPNLLPHEISFYNGLTLNLGKIASITQIEAYQRNINPSDETTLYLDIPRQKVHKEQMELQDRYSARRK